MNHEFFLCGFWITFENCLRESKKYESAHIPLTLLQILIDLIIETGSLSLLIVFAIDTNTLMEIIFSGRIFHRIYFCDSRPQN